MAKHWSILASVWLLIDGVNFKSWVGQWRWEGAADTESHLVIRGGQGYGGSLMLIIFIEFISVLQSCIGYSRAEKTILPSHSVQSSGWRVMQGADFSCFFMAFLIEPGWIELFLVEKIHYQWYSQYLFPVGATTCNKTGYMHHRG